MQKVFRKGLLVLIAAALILALPGCGAVTDNKRIIRVAHSLAETHPVHLGLLAFEEYIEEKFPDKYDVQLFPNELLGPSVKAIELCQTGAVDYVVSSTANLETFDNVYQIFSMPYLFDSTEVYHAVMNDRALMNSIYKSTEAAGFEAVAWFDSGSRNMYCKTPILTPDDMKGKKIRVMASPSNVMMMEAFGAAAAPMSFGEVYTAIQQGVIDGAENNELALTANKHGEVAKHFSYNMHQMIPDMMIGSLHFLNSLPPEDRAIFDEAADLCSRVECDEWDAQIQAAKEYSINELGVTFYDVDVNAFREVVLPLHDVMMESNPKLKPIYDRVQEIAAEVKEGN